MKWMVATLVALVPVAGHADKLFKKATNETWDCAKDAVVRINQSKGTFGFLGECKRITVSGSKNVLSVASVGKLVVGGRDNLVQVEEVDSIAVSGRSNQVTWTKAKKGDKPKVTKGQGNRVDKKK